MLLHAPWAKRNAGKGTPAKCYSMGNGSNAVPRSYFKGSLTDLFFIIDYFYQYFRFYNSSVLYYNEVIVFIPLIYRRNLPCW